VRKVALIFGTRPEAIKLAPVYMELRRRTQRFQPLIWATGQHRQMLDQALRVFDLRADRDFDLMRDGQTTTQVTCAVLEKLGAAFAGERPDAVLVQGDTTSAFAAALAAFYEKIPVGHVEAGLRTPSKYAPYPEEMNRRLATRLTDYHFAPTAWAQRNLLAEGIDAQRVWVTGNTGVDALALVRERVRRRAPAMPPGCPADRLREGARMVLITGHRRESFGPGFESIGRAIAELARRYADSLFVYPVHLNPNVREPVHRLLKDRSNVYLFEPAEYDAFVWLMERAHFILTDSGGIQEEAPYLGKPVLVMRETTERPEAIEAGTARLVGTDYDKIVGEASRLMDDAAAYAAMSGARNPFGDGHAAERIADALEKSL
jgi:UDP-N-acetylglucosamine 2-epimerase (non-hydrolysing)